MCGAGDQDQRSHRSRCPFGIENPPPTQGSDRSIPLTMPVVIVSLRPKELPIAITVFPTSYFEEFPNTRGLRKDSGCRKG
jgi:hypothetical protein